MPRKADIPGPGSYDIVEDFVGKPRSAGACTFQGRNGALQPESNPGPGEYTPNDSKGDTRVPARCLFGMASRFKDCDNELPGPCEYTPKHPHMKTPRRTIGEKARFNLPGVMDVTPGPGAYTPGQKSSARAQSANFSGGSGRWMMRQVGAVCVDSPGPATYQQQLRGIDRRAPSAGFGTTPRMTGSQADKETPGPGSYNWDKKRRGPRYTMAPRRDMDA
mmetsp:Transcript_29295/g.51276  ORF Transcript_29295/g.51276 Transcript_29295/m.51276 type:complete len:219 (+) Transcript_29295:107-763(+)